MRNFLRLVGEKFRAFMYGRYGFDELSMFLFVCSLVLTLLSAFLPILSIVSFAVLVWVLFRIHSRNHAKRRQELGVYLRAKTKIKQFFLRQKNRFRDRKTTLYFKCPSCKTILKVPKGKGKIDITCPKCKNTVTKKT